jgi:hypothetical protein
MAFRCFQKSSHVALDNEPQARKTRPDLCLKHSHAPPRIHSGSSRNITASSNDSEAFLADGLAVSKSSSFGSYRISIIERNQTEDTEEVSNDVATTGAPISAKKASPSRGKVLNDKTKGDTATTPDAKNPEAYSWAEAKQDKESLAKWKGEQRKSSKKEDEDALVAQARFETACQLLHKRILEKEHRLTVSERSFLNRLLDDHRNGGDNELDISDRLSAIEVSLHALDDDPLFKTPPSSPDKTMRAKTALRGVAVTDRTTINRGDQSQSSEDGSRGIEVLSTNSSQFSIEKALDKASKDKEENDLFRAHDTFRPRWRFEQNWVYTTFSRESEDELQIIEPPKALRLASSPPRRRTPERMRKVADELDLGSPFPILGIIPRNRILSAHLMEALRGFLPDSVAEQNYWLKYNSLRDKPTMTSLLTKIRASQNTIICIKATDGSVFGSSTSTPWRLQKGWYGAGGDTNSESFLFRSLSGKMEVYPYTGSDNLVQYCSAQILAIGGGDWQQGDSPYSRNESNGIGLLIDGDLQGGESNSCATFANPCLFVGGDGSGSVGNEFSIENMEVWTFTPCSDVASAEKMELRKLFLE